MFFRVMFKFMLHQYFILIFAKSQNLIDPVKSQPPHKTEVNKKYLVLCITSRANYTRLIQVLERAGRSQIQFFATISISNIYFIKQSGP